MVKEGCVNGIVFFFFWIDVVIIFVFVVLNGVFVMSEFVIVLLCKVWFEVMVWVGKCGVCVVLLLVFDLGKFLLMV